MILKKITAGIFICSIIHIFSYSFEWPQTTEIQDPIDCAFGQERGGVINTGIVFSQQGIVSAAGNGKVIAVQDQAGCPPSWFPSTLGNTVIIAHPDGLMSTYGNLKEITVDYSETEIKTGKQIGISGSSGWQNKNSALEFQIADALKHRAINPYILLPSIPQTAQKIAPSRIILEDLSGTSFNLNTVSSLQVNTYKVYRTTGRLMPYSTELLLNGAIIESITYDTVNSANGENGASGKRKYAVSALYPEPDRQFLGEINLTKGRNTLTVTVSNISGETTVQTFTLDIY